MSDSVQYSAEDAAAALKLHCAAAAQWMAVMTSGGHGAPLGLSAARRACYHLAMVSPLLCTAAAEPDPEPAVVAAAHATAGVLASLARRVPLSDSQEAALDNLRRVAAPFESAKRAVRARALQPAVQASGDDEGDNEGGGGDDGGQDASPAAREAAQETERRSAEDAAATAAETAGAPVYSVDEMLAVRGAMRAPPRGCGEPVLPEGLSERVAEVTAIELQAQSSGNKPRRQNNNRGSNNGPPRQRPADNGRWRSGD